MKTNDKPNNNDSITNNNLFTTESYNTSPANSPEFGRRPAIATQIAYETIPPLISEKTLENHTIKKEAPNSLSKLCVLANKLWGGIKRLVDIASIVKNIFLYSFKSPWLAKTNESQPIDLAQPIDRVENDRVVEVANKVRDFIEKHSPNSYRALKKIIEGSELLETSISNLIEVVSEKIERKELIINKVEERVLPKLTSYFRNSECIKSDGKVDEIKVLDNMEKEGSLPKSIYKLTKEDLDLLSSKEKLLEKKKNRSFFRKDQETLDKLAKIKELEEKIRQTKYEGLKVTAAKFCDGLILPEIKKAITIISKQLENNKNINLSRWWNNFITQYKVRDELIEKITNKLIDLVDEQSDPARFCQFLANRFQISPENKNAIPIDPLEMDKVELNPKYQELVPELINWILPGMKSSAMNVAQVAEKSTTIAKPVLGLISYLPSFIKEKSDWRVINWVTQPVKNVETAAKKAINVNNLPKKLQHRKNMIVKKIDLNYVIEAFLRQLDPKKEPTTKLELENAKTKAKTALAERLPLAKRIREGNKADETVSYYVGVDYSGVQGALNNDPDFDKFVTRTVENKFLNEVFICSLLESVTQGLDDGGFFKQPSEINNFAK